MKGSHMRIICGAALTLFAATNLCLADEMPYDILDAARRGDDHAVRKLLEKDPTLAREKDFLGYTPLDWAAVRGHWIVYEHLLDAGAPVNNIAGDGGTPMHRVCHHDEPEMLRLLIDAGADIAVANQWDRVPMHVAARCGGVESARVLLAAGADINPVTKEGWTPLHVAFMSGQPAMVELLLAQGADRDKKDSDGKRPKDYAFTRPKAIELAADQLEQYVGHYDLGRGFGFKIWREDDGLHIREFAPDRLYPVGKDQFYCEREPWRASFVRGDDGAITAVDVDFLRRTVRGVKKAHPLYVGSKACKECHMGRGPESEYIQWISSRHAAAYWRLATDWAVLLASFRPAYQDITEPATERRCLLCHTTAAQDPDALFAGSFRSTEGVGCESCHGPGSLYMDPDVMSDRQQFLAAGGIVPDEKTCRKCHRNAERFDFQTWWPKINHKGPPEPTPGSTHGEDG
jgi:hypothetical protein